MNAPGRWGVNLQERDLLLSPNWATLADSLVLNDAGLLQGRGALNVVSTTGGASENFRQFVYLSAPGVETLLTTQATKIFAGTSDLTGAGGDVTSATAPTAGYWKFANFNGKVVGWQKSHAPIVKTSGDFADIVASAGTLPDGDAMCAAFGRIWAVDDDRQTIRYCALLDETDWSTAGGGGAIDMRNVWTRGMDQVMALAAFGANLVVFGRRHIVFYSDGQGSTQGLDPTQMYVVDTIEGTGCVARDTVDSVGEGDLIFLGQEGLQSLRRLIAQRDNPLDVISWQIADHLSSAINTDIAALGSPTDDLRTFTGKYLEDTGQYMLVRDTGTTTDVYVFHMTHRTQDDKGRDLVPITFWDTEVLSNLKGFVTIASGAIYCTGGASNHIYNYDTSDALDATSTAIPVDYESGWLDLQDPQVMAMQKTLKFGQVTVNNPAGTETAITFKHAADYNATMTENSSVSASDSTRIVALYDTVGDIEGQYFKMGLSDTSFGRKVIQQMSLYFKPGRTASLHVNTNDVYSQAAVTGALLAGGLWGGGLPMTDQDDDTSGAGLTTYDVTLPTTFPSDTTAFIITVSTDGSGTLSGDVVATLGSSSSTLISLDIPGEGGVAGAFIGILEFDFDADLTPGVTPEITFTRSGGGAFPATWRASYRIWPLINAAEIANTDSDSDLTGSSDATVTLTLSATGAGSAVVAAAVPYVYTGATDVSATLDGVAMTLIGKLSTNEDSFASFVYIFAAEAAAASAHTIILTLPAASGGDGTMFAWASEIDAA